MLSIGGMTQFTTIDYPGELSAVVFLAGCVWKCKYCSNPGLLEFRAANENDAENWDYILEFLEKRKRALGAVVFSGGEATAQADDLVRAIEQIRAVSAHYKIGIHTNGALPEKLRVLLPLVDWVGLDVKTGANGYDELVGAQGAWNRVCESLEMLVGWGKSNHPAACGGTPPPLGGNSTTPSASQTPLRQRRGLLSETQAKGNYKFEVRTTIDPRVDTKDSILELARVLAGKGVKNYALQRLRAVGLAESEGAELGARSAEFFQDAEFLGKVGELFDGFVVRN
ncbi:MAG: anaerobic ribonucleoside-triphosphate reductase activating protein [Rickettsiales bacterium]|nr:anaerobic ribonucleoside-triphosphate reductase activating protein [Rickettsiales bacterium]